MSRIPAEGVDQTPLDTDVPIFSNILDTDVQIENDSVLYTDKYDNEEHGDQYTGPTNHGTAVRDESGITSISRWNPSLGLTPTTENTRTSELLP